jgi:hypothetical protein
LDWPGFEDDSVPLRANAGGLPFFVSTVSIWPPSTFEFTTNPLFLACFMVPTLALFKLSNRWERTNEQTL